MLPNEEEQFLGKGEDKMDYVLKTAGLTKQYGGNKAVNQVSMHVEKGSIYGFIGKNGAGKTTFMRMVAGLAAPTSGEIELFGSRELEKQRTRMGCLIEEPGLYGAMTARENLEFVRISLGIPEKDSVGRMLDFMGLGDTGRKKVRNFSMGMKQRLGIGVALFRNPDFLILDEPINGLDPEGIKEVRDLLLRLNREKKITILISSHILGELSKVATHYGIIRDGELAEEFSAKELEARCRRCQRITMTDSVRGAAVLEQQLHITNYDVPQEGVIRVFERLEDAAQMNQALAQAGVGVQESRLMGQDLEGYFMDLLGGAEHV